MKKKKKIDSNTVDALRRLREEKHKRIERVKNGVLPNREGAANGA